MIGASLRDPIFTWSDLKPKPITKAQADYIEQREIADEMERRYTEMVDSWIAVGNYNAMNEFSNECTKAAEKAHDLYLQIYCKHERAQFGETYCPDCNKRLED
jgi:hypothetical protein